MDVTKLVVGQDVTMLSGCYYCWGKVVEVTPDGVTVQTKDGLFSFDSKGKSSDCRATYECGAWYIQGTQPYDEVEITREPWMSDPPRSKDDK
jgi:hypothetical protein